MQHILKKCRSYTYIVQKPGRVMSRDSI
jgi:hypothetical protein